MQEWNDAVLLRFIYGKKHVERAAGGTAADLIVEMLESVEQFHQHQSVGGFSTDVFNSIVCFTTAATTDVRWLSKMSLAVM